eukprot:scaffold193233_cov28-Tisochrysis_lutea.AAC.2
MHVTCNTHSTPSISLPTTAHMQHACALVRTVTKASLRRSPAHPSSAAVLDECRLERIECLGEPVRRSKERAARHKGVGSRSGSQGRSALADASVGLDYGQAWERVGNLPHLVKARLLELLSAPAGLDAQDVDQAAAVADVAGELLGRAGGAERFPLHCDRARAGRREFIDEAPCGVSHPEVHVDVERGRGPPDGRHSGRAHARVSAGGDGRAVIHVHVHPCAQVRGRGLDVARGCRIGSGVGRKKRGHNERTPARWAKRERRRASARGESAGPA